MKNIVAFDIETTGVDKTRDHIIQISMIKFNPETYEVIDTYDSYVRPIGNRGFSSCIIYAVFLIDSSDNVLARQALSPRKPPSASAMPG